MLVPQERTISRLPKEHPAHKIYYHGLLLTSLFLWLMFCFFQRLHFGDMLHLHFAMDSNFLEQELHYLLINLTELINILLLFCKSIAEIAWKVPNRYRTSKENSLHSSLKSQKYAPSHSFNRHSLRAYGVPETMLHIVAIAMKKLEVPIFWETHCLNLGEMWLVPSSYYIWNPTIWASPGLTSASESFQPCQLLFKTHLCGDTSRLNGLLSHGN